MNTRLSELRKRRVGLILALDNLTDPVFRTDLKMTLEIVEKDIKILEKKYETEKN